MLLNFGSFALHVHGASSLTGDTKIERMDQGSMRCRLLHLLSYLRGTQQVSVLRTNAGPERALSHLFWSKPSRDYTPYGVVVVALRNRSDLRSKGAACLGGGAGLGTEYYTRYAFGAAANVAI
jgi:hypothetical protein